MGFVSTMAANTCKKENVSLASKGSTSITKDCVLKLRRLSIASLRSKEGALLAAKDISRIKKVAAKDLLSAVSKWTRNKKIAYSV